MDRNTYQRNSPGPSGYIIRKSLHMKQDRDVPDPLLIGGRFKACVSRRQERRKYIAEGKNIYILIHVHYT
jgi:hypothetical protein